MYYLTGAAIKYHRLGGLNKQQQQKKMYFLTVWRLEVQDQRAVTVGLW